MSALVSAVLVLFCFVASAGAQTRTLALYAGHAGAVSTSTPMIQQELQRLLAPAGVELIWKDAGQQRSGEEFDVVVMSSFDGACSMDEKPVAVPVSLSEGPVVLADTSLSDGRILPFFRIDCAQVIRTISPALEALRGPSRQAVLGKAIARVMAHEIYHIMARTIGHQESGVAKARFSIRDLTSDQFDFDVRTLAQMRPMPPPPSYAYSRSQDLEIAAER